LRLLRCACDSWLYGNDVAFVRWAGIDGERLFADGDRYTPHQGVAVVVVNLSPRPAVDHGLVVVPTLSLFALPRAHRHRAKLDSVHRTPRLDAAFEDLDTVKAGTGERLQQLRLLERPRHTARP